MLFNYVVLFMCLHAFITPVGNVNMLLRFTSVAWISSSDNLAHVIPVSIMVYLSLVPVPTPIPRLPVYSPWAVPLYVFRTRRETKSTRPGLGKRMTRIRAWLGMFSNRVSKLVKLSRPPAPTEVIRFPTRVLGEEPTAAPTTVHQRPIGALVDFRSSLDAYKLRLEWVLVTFGLMVVFLARFVRAASSEADALNSISLSNTPLFSKDATPPRSVPRTRSPSPRRTLIWIVRTLILPSRFKSQLMVTVSLSLVLRERNGGGKLGYWRVNRWR
ncbi:hypothetical protein RSAG8_13307, partial [Rhizoctonia solani AG-8 WAC10335]